MLAILVAGGCGQREAAPNAEEPEAQVAAATAPEPTVETTPAESIPTDGETLEDLDATTLGKGGSGRSGGSAPSKGAAPRSSPKAGSGGPGKGGPKTGNHPMPKAGTPHTPTPKTGSAPHTPKTGGAPHTKTGGAPHTPHTTPHGASNPHAGNHHAGGVVHRDPRSPRSVARRIVHGARRSPYWHFTRYFNMSWLPYWYEYSGLEDMALPAAEDGPINSRSTPDNAEVDDLIRGLETVNPPKGKP
jgi:hypothetical protein